MDTAPVNTLDLGPHTRHTRTVDNYQHTPWGQGQAGTEGLTSACEHFCALLLEARRARAMNSPLLPEFDCVLLGSRVTCTVSGVGRSLCFGRVVAYELG